MAILEINNLHFTYPGESAETLSGINISIRQGEFVVLCGPSGCGKTTLLRHLKPELAPVGRREGEIRYLGRTLRAHEPGQPAAPIGMVMQDPDNQIVMEQVLRELAFGLENIGVAPEAMRRRIAEMVHFFGMEDWLRRSTNELSGGQKQMVNLASALLHQPRVLLLDEPTAQLDPVAAKELLQLLRRLNEELGLTVIMTEHRLEELLQAADRVIVLGREGRIRYDGTPRGLAGRLGNGEARDYFEYMPSLVKLVVSLKESGLIPASGSFADPLPGVPLSVKEGRAWLEHCLHTVKAASGTSAGRSPETDGPTELAGPAESNGPSGLDRPAETDGSAKLAGPAISFRPSQSDGLPQSETPSAPDALLGGLPLLECRGISFRYDRSSPLVINQLDFTIRSGDFLAITGGNGSGKSTLLQLLCGLLRPRHGSVRFAGKDLGSVKERERWERIGYLPQNPLAYFLYDTVEAELNRARERSRLPDAAKRMERLIERFGLGPVLSRHPHDISGGERQRAALACVLLAGPELLLLDEPTKGIDPLMKQAWGKLLQELHREGLTVVLVTHDIEFAAEFAKRCAMLFDGAIASEGAPASFFGENYFYTTAISRLVRDRFPEAITYKDVLKQWPVPVSLSP